ncbi:type 4a pilus biogenesis protein PilO [Thalassotalea sp. 1_MG-2023]|uniref:type 4a pilus biogenesis protein PilO n=1 Tax=Thalassotalea sp. 1_MG-2023 TaxID=3062680 RepID=UPI0026E1DE29|nr:type 4a pilus biogenesis protein PilO [Thalassotalea sp. 1_MG-2023]MDO6425578.1 type 4a pilus biogenesis protein PilO [Thalassotalea sp. 1_MG-2023]
MKIDFSQFDNLELDNIGNWPPLAKGVFATFLAIVVIALGYFLIVSDKIKQLDRVVAEEATLKQQYQSKYYVAANLELFQQQMVEAETLFAEQLKSLPESHETPGLLDDITFVGTTSGLDFVKLNWQPEITQEIYIELPIDIEVVGSYHEFGNFVSKIAGLPRIVTLHDFDINMVADTSGQLNLKLQAKTYRYRETAQ